MNLCGKVWDSFFRDLCHGKEPASCRAGNSNDTLMDPWDQFSYFSAASWFSDAVLCKEFP